MKRNPIPSKTQLQKVLRESLFDPRAAGSPIAIVASMNNPNYGECKAIELVHEAQSFAKGNHTEYKNRISQAIALLALSRVQREG